MIFPGQNKKRALIFTSLGIVIGFVFFVGLRAALQKDHSTHHHANFAVYINGQKEDFNNFTFYEEVQSCSADGHENPKHRVHMHNNKNHLVHVHDGGATWGHFFANLGYGLTNNSVKTDAGIFVDGADGKELTFFLNRQPVESLANRVIESGDTLLIDYGDAAGIDTKYQQIPQDADEHNHKQDPSSCAGSGELTIKERVRRAFDLTR
jgi:hypothetical protein